MKDKMLERYEQCDNLKDLLKIRAELRPDVPIYAIYGRRADEPPVEITTAELLRQIGEGGSVEELTGETDEILNTKLEETYGITAILPE